MINYPRNRYVAHKARAKHGGVDFQLSFEEWWDIWQKSGHWNERGRGRGKYCMSRIGDVGPYAVGNVFIQTFAQNNSDAHKGKPLSKEHKEKMSLARTGERNGMFGKTHPKVQCPKCGKIGAKSGMIQWHFDKCKEHPL